MPISARTGKVVKYPKKGQDILYAIRGVRGGLKLLRKESQAYYKTDLKGLNRAVAHAEKNNFIIYEQKLRTLKRDSKGKIQYKKDTEEKLYKTKITFAKPKANTKPLLYAHGKKLRALDLAFRKGNYKKQQYLRSLTLIKPNTAIHEQVLTGRTLVSALSNIQVDFKRSKRTKGFGLYYNIFVLIQTPNGERVKVPANGSFYDKDYHNLYSDKYYFETFQELKVRGKDELFAIKEAGLLENLTAEMGKAIRYALKNTGDGYTFSSLAVLEQIEKRERTKLIKAKTEKEANQISKAIRGLWFNNNKRKYFEDKNTALIPLTAKYKVTLSISFEYM